MSKGEEKQQRASVRPSEEEYCHQCQRGRLLEILSLMEKELEKQRQEGKRNKEVAKAADETEELETDH